MGKQFNQITGQSSNIDERRQQQYTANKLAKNLWYKIQKELTSQQVEEVRQITEKVEQNKSQLDRMLSEEVTVGLKMVNHNVGKDQIENQSEEYRKYHGQEYEEEFQRQFPKLYQRLNTVQNVQSWNQYSQYN